jgi:hypothetical protein
MFSGCDQNAVWWYLRYVLSYRNLSYRNVEKLLAERGIQVDHVTIYRWVQRFALPELMRRSLPTRSRRSLVRGRDICESRGAVSVSVLRDRSVRPGDR